MGKRYEAAPVPPPEEVKVVKKTVLRRHPTEPQTERTKIFGAQPWKEFFPKESGRLYVGDEYQLALLGRPRVNESYQNEMREFIAHKIRKEPLEKFLKILRDHYVDDPAKLTTPFTSDMQRKITELAGLKPELTKRIKFYSSIGIKEIDHDLSTDGWFEVSDHLDRHAVAAIDVTMKNVFEKFEDQKESKPEIIIIDQVPANPTDHFYAEAIDFYAHRVFGRLQDNMTRYNMKWDLLR